MATINYNGLNDFRHEHALWERGLAQRRHLFPSARAYELAVSMRTQAEYHVYVSTGAFVCEARPEWHADMLGWKNGLTAAGIQLQLEAMGLLRRTRFVSTPYRHQPEMEGYEFRPAWLDR